jgi:hypothetical protein
VALKRGTWLVALACLVAACDAAPSNQITVNVVTRCGAPQPPSQLPAPPSDPHRDAFFSSHHLPLLLNQGGPVFQNPHLVAVFFGDDPLRQPTEALLQSYGCTSFWREAVSEYGVGDATFERSVVLPSFPFIAGQAQFDAWLIEQAGPLGLQTDERAFVFFPPRDAPVPENPCQDEFGYHGAISIDSREIAYAVVNDCASSSDWTTPMDLRSETLTHELIEMAVDPFPLTRPGWRGFDQESWAIAPFADENADVCVNNPVASTDYPFLLASAWSNRRALAGMHPCSSRTKPLALAMASQPTVDLSGGAADLVIDVYSDDPQRQYALAASGDTLRRCVNLLPQDSPGTVVDGDSRHYSVKLLTANACDPPNGLPDRFALTLYDLSFNQIFTSFVTVTGARP